MIYMDNAATTKPDPEVVDRMMYAMREYYGNPSSAHTIGEMAKIEIEACREVVADFINAEPEEIFFTSGGTEGNNLAMYIMRGDFGEILVSDIEHPSVLESSSGMRIFDDCWVPMAKVKSNGIVDLEYFKTIVEEYDACLDDGVSIMLANNEIGTIQPIKEIADICRSHKLLLHVDAVQAVGHIPIDVKDLGCDMLTASAHKFHGPKGVGFIYIRKGTLDKPHYKVPLLFGGGQERGMRSGTENVTGIIGMATALENVNFAEEDAIRILRDKFIDAILKNIPKSYINGDRNNRLPGNINVSFDGINGEQLAELLNQMEVCVSTGSACHSDSGEPSHVLKAIGRSDELANSSIRITLSKYNTIEECMVTFQRLKRAVEMLRGMNE